jgi:hypothetical protein
MKTFKKLLFLLILPSLIALAPADSFGAGPGVKREHAKRVIRRTAVVIVIAHKKVKEGKVYTGNLARAVAHQRFARKLYREGKFFRAIHHARRARFLAMLAIKANKGTETAEMKYSKEDEDAMKGGPSDAELDKTLDKEMPGGPTKDEEVVAGEPDVDLKDDE